MSAGAWQLPVPIGGSRGPTKAIGSPGARLLASLKAGPDPNSPQSRSMGQGPPSQDSCRKNSLKQISSVLTVEENRTLDLAMGIFGSRRGGKAAAAAVLLCAWMPHAANGEESRDIAVDMRVDSYDPVWTVSGHVVVGAMAPDRATSRPVLSLDAAELSNNRPEGRHFCLDMTSRSHSYRAQADISVPPGRPVPAQVPFLAHVERPEAVRKITGEEVAVRVEDSTCDNAEAGKDGALIIAGWGAGPIASPPAEVVLLLNARTSEAAVRLTSAGGLVDQKSCARVADPQQSGYDFICRMSLAKLGPEAKIIDGTVARRQFGQVRPPARFSILLRD